MKKIVNALICLLLINSLANASVCENTAVSSFVVDALATAPPSVYSPVTYWQNCSKPLVAIPSVGGTLNWYTTTSPSEVASAVAPTPNTATIGNATETFYVSQSIAGVESVRVPIIVNVAVDSKATILSLGCDATQIKFYSLNYSPPATVDNTVLFDWANNNGFISQTYVCTYSIQGGAPITGFNPNNSSHFIVTNLLPGQSVELTLTSASHPCVPSQKISCTVSCRTANVVPTFTSTPTIYCLNDIVVLPTTSDEGVSGTWSPSIVDTSVMGVVVNTFTPDPILFPCASKVQLPISVEPIKPDFIDFAICSGSTAPNLDTTSPNGITGTWDPLTVDNMNSGIYEFTPDPGQACAPVNKVINVTVYPSNTIKNVNWTTTDAFTKIQIVTVTDPVGANYLYQLDSGPFQTSAIFKNVTSGMHSITVKDANGCSELSDNNVLVIGYPKYFTPNGDTYNDTWNINELSDISSNSRIYIFDRYGKLLKDISPNETGWDGTFIGHPMPADDYWFTVEYAENNSVKKFKSHFSLKR